MAASSAAKPYTLSDFHRLSAPTLIGKKAAVAATAAAATAATKASLTLSKEYSTTRPGAARTNTSSARMPNPLPRFAQGRRLSARTFFAAQTLSLSLSSNRRMSAERPRVRAEGPGGPDIKQGARIACLDCRSAKIRCSAPSDGKVPCKRCARHGRECVFEKHRRGRKPGRSNNYQSGYAYSASPDHAQLDRMPSFYQTSSSGAGSPYTSSSQEPSRDQSVYQSHPSYVTGNRGVPAGASTRPMDSASSSPSYEHVSHNWRLALASSDPRVMSPPVHTAHGSSSFPGSYRGSDDQTSMYSSLEPNRQSRAQSFRGDGRPQPSYVTSAASPPLSYSSGVREGGMGLSASLHRREHSSTNFGGSANSPSAANNSSGRHGRKDEGSSSNRRDGMHLNSSLSAFYTSPRHTPSSEQIPSYTPSSSVFAMPPPLVYTPGTRSWLDFPTPGVRSTLSPSHLMATSVGVPTSSSSITNLQPAWPGSVVASPHKRKTPGDYFAGALPLSDTYSRESKEEAHISAESKEAPPASAAPTKRQRLYGDEQEQDELRNRDEDVSGKSAEQATYDDDDEQIDQLDEDLVNAGHEDDVLSTPLRLLAHASDAAASLKRKHGGKFLHPAGSRRGLGAATMNLISQPLPRLPAVRTWPGNNKPRLPSFTPYAPRDHPGTLLPALMSSAQRRDHQRTISLRTTGPERETGFTRPGQLDHAPRGPSTSSSSFPAPNLASIGRSRSYPAGESVHLSDTGNSPTTALSSINLSRVTASSTVTRDERRAEILGISKDSNGQTVEAPGQQRGGTLSVTPSTLDHDAWEYRDGRARTRKSFSTGAQTSLSGGNESGSKMASESESAKDEPTTLASAVEEDDGRMNVEAHGRNAELAFSKPRPSFSAGTHPRRWQIVHRRAPNATSALLVDESAISDSESDASEKLGAAHRDFFSVSIFHSKMDNEEDLDPVTQGILSLRELEKLFDIFFARINPIMGLFDPFLHSVTYVRARSAMLTSVIAALAARLSDTERDANISVELESHWRQRLLPEALLGGYKSVELSQAFVVLALYHKPTNRLSEDRSWQYLGFAIRIATEIGINRLTQPSLEVKDNEQVRRRMRNRVRLWITLYLVDRALSMQTGRQTTLTEDGLLAHTDLWHREAFALPSDARLVSLLKLKRIVTSACRAHDEIIANAQTSIAEQTAPAAAISQWHETIKSLVVQRLQAHMELDRWQDVWCVQSLEETNDGIQTLAIASFLEQWRPRALIDNMYARLHLDSMVLETSERLYHLILAAQDAAKDVAKSRQEVSSAVPDKLQKDSDVLSDENKEENSTTTVGNALTNSSQATSLEMQKMIDRVSLDCWEGSLRMLNTFINDVPKDILTAAPNALAVKVIYASLAALRLVNSGDRAHRPWASLESILPPCKKIADLLIKAGRTPAHRNGAAAPFGLYLKRIVSLWESENSSTGTAVSDGSAVAISKDPSSSNLETTINDHVKDFAGLEADPRALPISRMGVPTDNVPTSGVLAAMTSSTLQKGLVSPAAPSIQQHIGTPSQIHSVGDDLWGTASSRRSRTQSNNVKTAAGAGTGTAAAATGDHQQASDPEEIDRMWDYLTTYTDTATTFPLSLWQQQSTSGVGAGIMTMNSNASSVGLNATGGNSGIAAATDFAHPGGAAGVHVLTSAPASSVATSAVATHEPNLQPDATAMATAGSGLSLARITSA